MPDIHFGKLDYNDSKNQARANAWFHVPNTTGFPGATSTCPKIQEPETTQVADGTILEIYYRTDYVDVPTNQQEKNALKEKIRQKRAEIVNQEIQKLTREYTIYGATMSAGE
jgi:hypothetical protein